MAVVYIGIGSNLGDREGNCTRAVARLEQKGLRVRKRSSVIGTKAWGKTDQPDFINLVVEANTSLGPCELLKVLLEIEEGMGRERTTKWGPRIIDLDILLYDDLCLETENLTVPHPLMQERDFVLRPMAEIAPAKIHPMLRKTMAELLEELEAMSK
ncbi:MAG: 2-amino-4-hydroxy-6-hydroxymethyldihydropteridine diphosphokinase [Nitrospiraceae bacterium]|nr:2-amino-4-hydroxy-6-hydroxymethyldihydropteridine diphosphokinase [Nitrospiraceae bacterium]